jgi:hypothetical protein
MTTLKHRFRVFGPRGIPGLYIPDVFRQIMDSLEKETIQGALLRRLELVRCAFCVFNRTSNQFGK